MMSITESNEDVSGRLSIGKTTLALQFLLEGARAGEKCLYITLSETPEGLRSVARSHGWSLQAVTIDLSYLTDTLVLLRYFESHGAVKKAISVIKKRSGAHEETIREFRLGPNGVFVGPALSAFQGVLNGVPTYNGELGSLLRKDGQLAER
jgi:hypothetical protein